MTQTKEISRRQFVTSAAAVAAISSLPLRDAFAAIGKRYHRQRVHRRPQSL